jgi:hypothetical protein
MAILSWFLLPFSFIGVVISHEISFKTKYEAGRFGTDFIYILILNLPFVIGLVWSYFSYSRTSSP